LPLTIKAILFPPLKSMVSSGIAASPHFVAVSAWRRLANRTHAAGA
jgi:hypothetical protein